MINLGLLALGVAVLLLLQLVAAVEARTRALPAVPRSGVSPPRRPPAAATTRSFDRDAVAGTLDRPGAELARA
jgi:hypothetical protein